MDKDFERFLKELKMILKNAVYLGDGYLADFYVRVRDLIKRYDNK